MVRPTAPVRRRQRTVTVDEHEGDFLEGVKRLWQDDHGRTDWGKLLITLLVAGIAAYGLSNSQPAQPQSDQWSSASCPACHKNVPIQLSTIEGTARYLACPFCSHQFLVYDPQLVPAPMRRAGL